MVDFTDPEVHFKSNPGYTRGYFIIRSYFKIIYVNFISFSLCPLSLMLYSFSAFSISWRRLVFCSCSCLLVSFWVWSQELLSRGCTPGVDQVRCWSTSAAHLAHLSGSVKCWAEHCLWGFFPRWKCCICSMLHRNQSVTQSSDSSRHFAFLGLCETFLHVSTCQTMGVIFFTHPATFVATAPKTKAAK